MPLNLDSQQIDAVESRSPVTVVVAGPGAGKSRTLVARIHHLIDQGVNPSDFCVLTFTNAGANELRERLGGIKLGFLGTLHGWCFRLLQRHGNAIGYREGGINLLSADMDDELLMAAAERLHWKDSKKKLLEAKMPLAKLIRNDHRHTMKRNNLVNYDGVLESALGLLESRASDDFRFQLPRYLLVDECQDNAEVDWDIYGAIAAESAFFVGDSDQGVFSFRGASPAAFTRFCRQHSPLFLEWNYRSGPEICTAANMLIDHNTDRILKECVPVRTDACRISVTSYDTCLGERVSLSVNLGTRLSIGGVSLSDIAVLCRTNEIATQFRDHLAASGIQVRRPKQQQLPLDWGHALNVLNLWNDPRNDIIAERVLRVLMNDPQGTGGTLKVAKKRALEAGDWLTVEIDRMGVIPGISAMTLEDLPKWGVDKESCALIETRLNLLPQQSLVDLLHDLYNSANWEAKEDGCGVHVGTIHGAKGREWDVVFLPAWEEGVFPQAKKDTDIEEERRLAFVAITRARNEVHISYAKERVGQWKTVQAEPSRFIAEAGL